MKGSLIFGIVLVLLVVGGFMYGDQVTEVGKSWWPFGEEEPAVTRWGTERETEQNHFGSGDNVAGNKSVQECKQVVAEVRVLEMNGAVNGIFRGKGVMLSPQAGTQVPIELDIPFKVDDIIKVCQSFVVE